MTILVDSSGFCQQLFHRQIEVLKPEKGKKATGQKSSAKKSLSFKDVSSSVVNTDSDHNELSTSGSWRTFSLISKRGRLT